MRGIFRRAVVVFYWIALPFALLLCAGWALNAGVSSSGRGLWMMAAGAGAFAALIAWRLWLNSRALGRAGPMPPTRRLLLVFLPLTVLALAGIGLVALGLIWLSVGVWLLLGPELATSGYRDLVSGAALPIGSGALMVLVGGALIVPLRRSLKARALPAAKVLPPSQRPNPEG